MTVASYFPSRRAGLLAASVVAGLALGIFPGNAWAQDATPQAAPAQTEGQTANAPAQGAVTLSNQPAKKSRKQDKEEKVVQSKDTKKDEKKTRKVESLAGVDSKLPDKQLFDKALVAMNKGHYDVARLDLQTMLNTYPDSQYQMRAKLAIADSWYKEGGTAALTQAESEYADFRVFFPNAPEAAEAQMRIGDIYFKQMDKPDRDYAKATHAEEEYRRMLTDYPDSVLVPEAKQKLRDVQEVLATREAAIGQYYASHENWAAAIARLETVVETYPYYSHIDDALIGLGDAFEAEARYVRSLKQLPEGARAKLLQTYDGEAASAYRAVVLDHSAAPHVEDAKDRLVAMGLPVPTPTPAQIAASAAMENSRHTYGLSDHLGLFFLHKPDVVSAARIGEPSLVDPKQTLAPLVAKKVQEDFREALDPNAAKAAATAQPAAAAETDNAAPASAAPVATAPLQLNEVPSSDGGSNAGPVDMTPATRPVGGAASGGTGMGVEIVAPARSAPTPPVTDPPAATVPMTPNPAPSEVLKPVGPPNAAALPPVEKPTDAPGTVNEVAGTKQAAAQTPAANGKKGKPAYDGKDESSSKHKKKTGLEKLNPF